MALGRRREDSWDGIERRAASVVMVVNDDPDACEMLVRMVGSRGYRAIGATSLEEAGGRYSRELPRCVVLDVHEGGIGTSLKALDTIRSRTLPAVGDNVEVRATTLGEDDVHLGAARLVLDRELGVA